MKILLSRFRSKEDTLNSSSSSKSSNAGVSDYDYINWIKTFRLRIFYCFMVLAFFVQISYSQESKSFGKEGFNFNLGCGVVGPILSIGETTDNFYGELYYEHHLFDWEKDENLVNKPTSGGFQLGFNFIPNYLSSRRFKFVFGLGAGTLEERSGTNTGENYTGEIGYYYVNGGLRVFLSPHIFLQAWVGYPFNLDKSESILTKYYSGQITNNEQIIPVSISVQFRL